MKQYINKHSIGGTILFLAFVGEINVGFANGLFTPAGFITLCLLYFFYFLLVEALAQRFKLSNAGVVLINFALYSILITGLFHGELADPVLHPDRSAITLLIRIQCSFYPVFAFYLLRRCVPKPKAVPKVSTAAGIFILYMLLLTPSQSFGFIKLIDTINTAPWLSGIGIVCGIAAFVIGLRQQASRPLYVSRRFTILTWLLLLTSLIPGILFFMLLLLSMIIVSLRYLAKRDFRHAAVW